MLLIFERTVSAVIKAEVRFQGIKSGLGVETKTQFSSLGKCWMGKIKGRKEI